MNDREDLARRLYEVCLSGSVPTLDALIEKDQLILNRVNSLECFLNEITPSHVAVLCGHLDFAKALVARKAKLATELDSQWRSPLHLASSEGNIEIVQELLRANKNVCVTRDEDGRIPLHLAAMKGRVEVIQKLLGAEPDSIHEKLDRKETVLHLCVKYNKLEALKTLVQYLQANKDESLLNSKDDDGNTILHAAAALKQMETLKYLFGIKSVKDQANVKNKNDSTALDVMEYCPNRDLKTMEIREFLLQAGVRRSVCGGPDPNLESRPHNPPPPRPPTPTPQRRCCKAGLKLWRLISWFWKKFLKVDPVWVNEVRGHLITASTVMLVASLITIMLAMTEFPMHNKLVTWLLVFTVYITITCMASAYIIAMTLVSPISFLQGQVMHILFRFMDVVIRFVAVLHACRLLVWLVKKLVKFVKACYRCCGPTPRAT